MVTPRKQKKKIKTKITKIAQRPLSSNFFILCEIWVKTLCTLCLSLFSSLINKLPEGANYAPSSPRR